MPTHEAVRQRVLAAVHAHLRGEETAPLYLATGHMGAALGILGAAAATVRAAGRSECLLVCTGSDFAGLWCDTLRRGMTPFVRRAQANRRVIVLDGLEVLHDEPFAQGELARLIAPERLVVLAGCGHLRHVSAWSPALAPRLVDATELCLHAGPCVTDADARALIDRVAGYYGLTRAQLLSRRRTAAIARARQIAMFLLREEGLTYSAIGRLLRRDHSTVTHGHALIHWLAARQSGVRHDLDTLRRAHAA